MGNSKTELEVMAHRYLYYVLCSPVLPDCEYDKLEREARKTLPEESLVNKVGSCLASGYSNEIVNHALKKLGTKHE